MKYFLASLFILLSSLFFTTQINAATYYIAPNKDLDESSPNVVGNDTYSGTTATVTGNIDPTSNKPEGPFKTINAALGQVKNNHAVSQNSTKVLSEGVAIVLLNGIYTQSISPTGLQGSPEFRVIIRAHEDGQAIIDGEYVRIPVSLQHWSANQYYQIEGIVARNSSGNVYALRQSNNNVFKRVSGYNANTDSNSFVFELGEGSFNNTVEDCVAAGTGRKMILMFHTQNNIVRRCFTDWHEWDGRDSCQIWPWGENIDIYSANDNLVENSIGIGRIPLYSFTIRANAGNSNTINNRFRGNISLSAGVNKDGSIATWPSQRPQPTTCTEHRDMQQTTIRTGFKIFATDGTFQNNTMHDIFAWGGALLGLSANIDSDVITGNNPILVKNATIVNNGLDSAISIGGMGTGAIAQELSLITLQDSNIENVWNTQTNTHTSINGTGAKLKYRYKDGVLTQQELWPWPMEERIKAEYEREFGIADFSVTNSIVPILQQYGALDAGVISPTISSPVDPGDTDADGDVDIFDYNAVLGNMGTVTGASRNGGDLDGDGDVDIFDYNEVIGNFGR